MQVGCGIRVKEIKGHEYVYFWHYEERGGRSRQVFDYIGPRRFPGTARRLSDSLEAYYARAADRMRRDLAAHRAAIEALRG